jgi:hypothetical protein
MSTIDLASAVKLVRGEFPEDPYEAVAVYENQWGGESFKALGPGQTLEPSNWVKRPTRVWEKGQSPEQFVTAVLMWRKVK